MTIKKRLARSNLAMLVIPLLTAAVLAALGAGALAVLLRENMTTLHDAAEQLENVLHGFKLTLVLYAAVLVLLVLASVALTNICLTRRLFRRISQPLDTLTAGVARIRDGDLDTPIAYAEPDEFKAACDAVDEMAARLKPTAQESAILMAGPLTADTACRRVTKDGVEIDLKNKEYELLLFLMRHPGQVFSREDLYEMIWGLESMGDNITVAVHINRLREKLEEDPGHPQLLQTVWGVGYRLKV